MSRYFYFKITKMKRCQNGDKHLAVDLINRRLVVGSLWERLSRDVVDTGYGLWITVNIETGVVNSLHYQSRE